jgi:hypothetical protein
VRIPIDPLNIPWQIVEPHLWKLVDYFQIPYPQDMIMLRRGWYFDVKADLHEDMGTVWSFVTPQNINICVYDADSLTETFARRNDFPRPKEYYRKCD